MILIDNLFLIHEKTKLFIHIFHYINIMFRRSKSTLALLDSKNRIELEFLRLFDKPLERE